MVGKVGYLRLSAYICGSLQAVLHPQPAVDSEYVSGDVSGTVASEDEAPVAVRT